MVKCHICETIDVGLEPCFNCGRLTCEDDLYPGHDLQMLLCFNGKDLNKVQKVCFVCRLGALYREDEPGRTAVIFSKGKPPLDSKGHAQSGAVFTPTPLARARFKEIQDRLKTLSNDQIKVFLASSKIKVDMAEQLLMFRQQILWLIDHERRGRAPTRQQKREIDKKIRAAQMASRRAPEKKSKLATIAAAMAKAGITPEALKAMLGKKS